MTYSIQQLSNQRWGIYVQTKLLATYGCQHNCLRVWELLEKRNKTGFKTYKMTASASAVKQAA
ncbi:hypothetical protein I4641_05285 [Waterburya agarophytonicola K14]|uniref:Uncharacterized protein n=1 Tax=Waterburya agarophytonicola KI4 TaxID=2874699 RepID=A0A964BMW4_9CYAN|nr:hypothetical protein [Waterburya agarophytonicola]MCC0176389.1 hypothetical protein [Waterburya agarophytonicola KI4]